MNRCSDENIYSADDFFCSSDWSNFILDWVNCFSDGKNIVSDCFYFVLVWFYCFSDGKNIVSDCFYFVLVEFYCFSDSPNIGVYSIICVKGSIQSRGCVRFYRNYVTSLQNYVTQGFRKLLNFVIIIIHLLKKQLK